MSTPSNKSHAIEIKSLKKVFRLGLRLKRIEAVSGISFTVPKGSVFGFLGPNGAGKTTTIKMLTGLIHPTSGNAQLLGEAIGTSSVRMKLGYLPEHPYFYDYLTGFETLMFYGRLFGIDGKTLRNRSNMLLDRVGLHEAKNRRVRKYSKGMTQRMGIAQALINDPDLVILDEPLSGLDPIGRKDVRDILVDLKREGKTIFFSSHILADIEMICDEVAIINRGKLIESGSISDLLTRSEDQVEIMVRTKGSAPVLDMVAPADSLGDVWRYQLKSDQVSQSLETLIKHKIEVLSLTPKRSTLEDLFMSEVGAHEGGEVSR
jgi:ABC-2 type transport system ATP-binding protein